MQNTPGPSSEEGGNRRNIFLVMYIFMICSSHLVHCTCLLWVNTKQLVLGSFSSSCCTMVCPPTLNRDGHELQKSFYNNNQTCVDITLSHQQFFIHFNLLDSNIFLSCSDNPVLFYHFALFSFFLASMRPALLYFSYITMFSLVSVNHTLFSFPKHLIS